MTSKSEVHHQEAFFTLPIPNPCHTKCRMPKKIISVKLHLSENPFPSALSVQLCTGLKASGRPIIPTFHHPNPHRRMMKTPENNTRALKLPRVRYG